MRVSGQGVGASYSIGPLHWNGKLEVSQAFAPNGQGYRTRVKIAEDKDWGNRSETFEWFTDEQMEELFLAYIALKEARNK